MNSQNGQSETNSQNTQIMEQQHETCKTEVQDIIKDDNTIYPPFHEKFNREKYVEFIQISGDREERKENLKKLSDWDDAQIKQARRLLLSESTQALCQKLYFTALKNNQESQKILSFFTHHEKNWNDLTAVELMEIPFVAEWYNKQGNHVRKCYLYWKKAIHTRLSNAVKTIQKKSQEKQKHLK